MLKNYLTIVYRNLFKQRTSSFINIAGLAIALACCIFILLYVFDEFQYDKFNNNEDRIYRLVFRNGKTGAESSLMPAALYPKIVNGIPEIEKGFIIADWRKVLLAYKNNSFTEDVYFAGADLFNVLTFPLLRGNPQNVFKEPFSIVITPAVAKKYFGNADPVGKVFKLFNKYDFTVTGILKEVPQHSSLRPSIIASINSLKIIQPDFFTKMRISGAYFYFLLKKNSSIAATKNELNKVYKKQFGGNSENSWRLELEPLSKVYLYSTATKWEIVSHGNINYIRGFAVIAFLILIMASFNYTNLLTVNIKIREKEFAVRKLLGANRKAMIGQFLIETVFYQLTAFVIALAIVDLLMNRFNQLTGKHLNFASLFQWEIIAAMLGLILITTVSSIIYPSIIAFTSDSLARLKGSSFGSRFKPAKLQFGFRQIVTGLQFIITIALIAVVVIIFDQINYMLNRDLGFNKEHLLSIQNYYGQDNYSGFEEFKNEVSQNPHILSITAGEDVPSNNFNNFTQVWIKGNKTKNNLHAAQVAIDYDYLNTLKAKFLEGRNFSRNLKTDISESVIVNQTAAKELGLKNPVGAELSGINNTSGPQRVIGVVKDIHFESFKEKVPPVIFYLRQWCSQNILIRLGGDNIVSTMKYIKVEWEKINPSQPFIYSFLDQAYDNLYKSEERTSTVILIFCLFAIIISCIGLFSLVSLLVQTRRKEIGVRKVLGASILNAIFLMIREYIIMIAAANVIAVPAAYVFMNNWLRNFAYRIHINIWMFVISGLVVLVIAMLTVSVKAIKAATTNPVDSLRYE